LITKFGRYPNLGDGNRCEQFYTEFATTSFYWYMSREGRVMPREILLHAPDLNDWDSIWETILRWYSPPGKADNYIWGDKTPSYILHMPLLKDIHPEAKFLHIVRDPRDCALSSKRAWGKSLYRSASRWAEAVAIAQRDGAMLGQDYLEIRYECLLDSPKELLQQVCCFLQCDFLESMTTLARPAENLGAAKGSTKILCENKHKFGCSLSPKCIRRIEEIVFPVAMSAGYTLEQASRHRPMSRLMLQVLRLHDGITYMMAATKQRGVSQVLRWMTQQHRQSGWR